MARFIFRCPQIRSGTVPVDKVIYGLANNTGLIDETGAANTPGVVDTPEGHRFPSR